MVTTLCLQHLQGSAVLTSLSVQDVQGLLVFHSFVPTDLRHQYQWGNVALICPSVVETILGLTLVSCNVKK